MKEKAITFIVAIFINGGLYAGYNLLYGYKLK
jgi:hypothetical protein